MFHFPDDGLRRELIGGRLYVSLHPRNLPQIVVRKVSQATGEHVDAHGGQVFPGCNVDLAVGDHVERDVVALGADVPYDLHALSIESAPSLVVEVSSSSTRTYDLGAKRALYERHGVPEFWFVDLEESHVRAFRLAGPATASRRSLTPPVSFSRWPSRGCGFPWRTSSADTRPKRADGVAGGVE